jgi:hypothetical protein
MFSLFVASFLIAGFLFLALPEKGFAGVAIPSIGCCIGPNDDCVNFDGDAVACQVGSVVDDGTCTFEGPGGICTNVIPISTPIPTMSEWGLIATALVLAAVGAGYITLRRKKASEM